MKKNEEKYEEQKRKERKKGAFQKRKFEVMQESPVIPNAK